MIMESGIVPYYGTASSNIHLKQWHTVAGLFRLGCVYIRKPLTGMLFGLNNINEIPLALLGEIILLNGVLSLFAANYFRKFGFLAAVGIHFWADVIWHVIWGVI